MIKDLRIHPHHHHKKLVERKPLTLRRDLTLLQATSCGVGIISGAGIYALIGVAAGIAGNAVWLSFLISAFIAVFSGLSYAELSSMFPSDAGEYIYAEKSFGHKLAFIVGWLVLSAGIISITAVALGFAGYFVALIGVSQLFGSKLFVALAAIALICVINSVGVRESTQINVVLTFFEVGGLLLVIFLGIPSVFKVLIHNPGSLLVMPNGFQGVLSGAALVFFAFIGFESVVKLSEETKNPEKVIPKALMLSIAITTVLYILVAISAVSVLGWEALGQSAAPLADVGAKVMGNTIFVILGIIALFSTFNTILISMLATSRIAYGMGHGKSLPKFLSDINPRSRTPWKAIFLVTILAGSLLALKRIELVAEMTNFSIFVTFVIVNASLIALRIKEPNAKRPFKVPVNIGKVPISAVIAILLCLFMMKQLSWEVIVGGGGILTLGILINWWLTF